MTGTVVEPAPAAAVGWFAEHPDRATPRPRPTERSRQPAPPGFPAAAPLAGGPGGDEGVAARLRNDVVNRLRRMIALHSRHAWDQRRSDPLGPHALAFFYAEPDPTAPPDGGRPWWRVRTATRMFLDGAEVRDLPRLLHAQAGIAAARLRSGGLDPRTEMANRCEPMGSHASYHGVAVSTLDTPTGRWTHVQDHAGGVLDIPGRGYARLVDGTTLLCQAHAQNNFGEFTIHSTRSLNIDGQPVRIWAWAHDVPEHDDPGTARIWHQLDQLHQLLWTAHHAR